MRLSRDAAGEAEILRFLSGSARIGLSDEALASRDRRRALRMARS
jgi:hypothetical protein